MREIERLGAERDALQARIDAAVAKIDEEMLTCGLGPANCERCEWLAGFRAILAPPKEPKP